MEVQSLPEDEQQSLRDFWAQESWTRYGPPAGAQADTPPPQAPPSEGATKEGTSQSASEPSVASVASQDDSGSDSSIPSASEGESHPKPPAPPASSAATPTSDIVSKISSILTSYRLHDRPKDSARNEIQPETAEALNHIRDLEVFMGEPTEAGQVEAIRTCIEKGDKERDLEMDDKLQELVPYEEYTETPTQQGLTVAEGTIIDALLGFGPTGAAGMESPSPAKVDLKPEIERLDRIMEVIPQVRQMYARALKLPSRSDHDDCRELLVRMGVPVLVAEIPYEAEGLASSLARRGLVDFVATEDSDVLGYEVRQLLARAHFRDLCSGMQALPVELSSISRVRR